MPDPAALRFATAGDVSEQKFWLAAPVGAGGEIVTSVAFDAVGATAVHPLAFV